jgi:membrane-associated phospholipid phosphatase
MTGSRRPSAAAGRFIAAIVVLVAVWLTMLAWGAGPLDRAIYEMLYAGDGSALATVARFFTALGEPTILIGAGIGCALWLWYAGHRHLPWLLIAITMVGRSLSELQKYWIARLRPELEPHLVVVKTSSFPSGHATSSMIFYLTVAIVLTQGTRWQWPAVGGAILLSLLIGISRVMLGVHWPSDVIGGWAFGMLWVLLTLRLAGRVLRSSPGSTRGRLGSG